MKIARFEDIISWQKSKVLSVLIYQTFEHDKDFGFRNQIERAAVSVMNNIAEGFERQTNKEFKHFYLLLKALVVKFGQCFISQKN